MQARDMEELASELNTTHEELIAAMPCYVNRCGGHFTLRHNHKTGSAFFGCSNWPKCDATRGYWSVSRNLAEQFLGVVDDDDIDMVRWDR